MKSHHKRFAAPRSWILDRKADTFTMSATPSGHPSEMSLPLGIILRDMLQLGSTAGEIQKLLHNTEVLVDGRRRTDRRFAVGLFDVLRIPSLGQAYRITLDRKGRLSILPIQEAEQESKPCKIIGKTALPGGMLQYHLHDGKNIVLDTAAGTAKVGDTLLLGLPQLKVKEIFSLKPGMSVFFTRGKHSGDVGTLKEIRGKQVTYLLEGKEIETVKEYAFVVGEKSPGIAVNAVEHTKGEIEEKKSGQRNVPTPEKKKSKEKKEGKQRGQGKQPKENKEAAGREE